MHSSPVSTLRCRHVQRQNVARIPFKASWPLARHICFLIEASHLTISARANMTVPKCSNHSSHIFNEITANEEQKSPSAMKSGISWLQFWPSNMYPGPHSSLDLVAFHCPLPKCSSSSRSLVTARGFSWTIFISCILQKG